MFSNFELTNKGIELLNNVIANKKTLLFTKFEIGNGEFSGDKKTLTKLVSKFAEFSVNETSVLADGITNIKGFYDNKGLDEAKKFTEIGIYAQIQGESLTEVLFSYSNQPISEAETIPDKNSYFSRTFSVMNKTSSVSSVTFEITEKKDKYVFGTLAEMKSANYLDVGDKVELWGNLTLGDSEKQGFIIVKETQEIELYNGLFAKKYLDLSEKLDKGGYSGTAQELFELIKNYCPYQIGDIYQTTNKVNPSEIWQGTEWQRIEGRVLKGTSGERNSKETGGSNTVKLTVDNIPSHNHSATNSAHTHSSGNHNHYIFSSSTGGSHITDSNRKEYAPNYRAVLRNTTDRDDYVIAGSGGTANAGRTSSSNITIGSATTTTTIGSTGKGTEFSVENEYYTVHMWLRTK